MNTFEVLQDKIEKAKALDFGELINKIFDLFKKTWLNGFFLLLITVIILTPVFIVFYMPMYTSIMEQIQSGGYDPSNFNDLVKKQQGEFKYMILGFTFLVSFISTALTAGFYRLIKNVDHGEESNFSMIFYFFKGKYLGKIFTIAAFSLMVALLGFVLELFLPQNIAAFIKVVISLPLMVYTSLFIVFLAFNPDLDMSSIFSLSFNLGTKKWLLILGLLLVTYIIGVLGIVACFVGIMFTMAIVYLPAYIIYKDVVGFNTVDDLDLIGEKQDYE